MLWCGWIALSTAGKLSEAGDQSEIMRAALVRGDIDGTRAALTAYQEAVDGAQGKTSGLTWGMFEHLPWLGDDADGIAAMAQALSDIGRDALPPVTEAAAQVTAETFQPSGHRFPLKQIAALEEPADRSQQALDAAATDLEGIDSTTFVGPVRERFDALRAIVEDARDVLGTTYRAARLMPVLLGDEQPRNYLMVLQNNAEARSSGGLPGSLSMVRAEAGKVRIIEQTDMASLGVSDQPILPLTDEERELFGTILGTVGVDATLTPDFPRAAALIKARWEQVLGQRVDGVVFVDPVAVSYLLAGMGPLPVPGHPPVTAGNVVASVENEIYLQTQDREAQSDYQNAVAKAVFDAFADGTGDAVATIRGLATSVAEGRVRMHLFDDDAQAEVEGTAIAGEFDADPTDRPEVGVYLNDAGPTKMQFYLAYDASLVSRSCLDDQQELAGKVSFRSNAPPTADTLPPSVTGEFFPGARTVPGDQLLVVYLTSPVGGEVVSLTLNGQPVAKPAVKQLAGHEVAVVGVTLEPGQHFTVEYVMSSGPDQTAGARLEVSPGALPGSSNATIRSSCEIR